MRLFPLIVAKALMLVVVSGSAFGVEVPLDSDLATPQSVAEQFRRHRLIYGLNALLSAGNLAEDLGRSLRFDSNQLADGVTLSQLTNANGELDEDKTLEIFQAHYNGNLVRRAEFSWIKLTLDEVEEITNFRSWQVQVVPLSRIKRKTRVIYRSPVGFSAKMSVSETLESTSGDRSAPVLETEITIKVDGDYRFFSYDELGNLSDIGHFPAGIRSSPSVCLGCHYNRGQPGNEQFDRFIPQEN